MKKKKSKSKNIQYIKETLSSMPREKVKFKWRKALIMLALSAPAYAILKLFLSYDIELIWIIYELLIGIPMLCYLIFVRGNLSPRKMTPDMLSDTLNEQQKQEYIELDWSRKQKGKKFIYIALPFVFALMVAIVTEIYIPNTFG